MDDVLGWTKGLEETNMGGCNGSQSCDVQLLSRY
jgi:hypothetical protein